MIDETKEKVIASAGVISTAICSIALLHLITNAPILYAQVTACFIVSILCSGASLIAIFPPLIDNGEEEAHR